MNVPLTPTQINTLIFALELAINYTSERIALGKQTPSRLRLLRERKADFEALIDVLRNSSHI